MEGGVASPFHVCYRPLLLVHSRVVGFETEIETEQELCEVESKPETV